MKASTSKSSKSKHNGHANAAAISATLQETMSASVERASEGLKQVGAQMSDMASSFADRSVTAGKQATAYVRANPGKSFAIALAAGFVIAKLVQRRSNA